MWETLEPGGVGEQSSGLPSVLRAGQRRTSSQHSPDPRAELSWDGRCRDGTGSVGTGDRQHKDGMGSTLALKREKAAALLHGDAEAEPQMPQLKLQPHPKVFFLKLN